MKQSLLILLLLNFANLIAQTSLSGKVKDAFSQPLILGDIAVFKNQVLIAKEKTDFDGNYNFVIDAGTYNVEVSYEEIKIIRVVEVLVLVGKANNLDIVMPIEDKNSGQIQEIKYVPPPPQKPCNYCSRGLTSEQIKNLPVRDIDKLKAQAIKKAKREKRKSRWFWNKNRGK